MPGTETFHSMNVDVRFGVLKSLHGSHTSPQSPQTPADIITISAPMHPEAQLVFIDPIQQPKIRNQPRPIHTTLDTESQNPEYSQSRKPTVPPVSPQNPVSAHHPHHAGHRQHATAPSRNPIPKLRSRPLNSIHALERPLSRNRFAITHCRRALRIHGTRIPTRRSVISLESGTGYTNWRDCGV